jgi:ABC-type phosphate transport system permease subunit
MKRKTVFLILLLVVTAIPTVLFILNLVYILGSYIQTGGGYFRVDWHDQIIWLESRIGGVGMYIGLFVLALICIPLFFASILLLYKEWQTKKKKKAEKPMTYTI